MSLRRRLRELEARVAELEAEPTVDYAMPPAPTIPSEPVDAHSRWRGLCSDYAEVRMYDVEDDRARHSGVYL